MEKLWQTNRIFGWFVTELANNDMRRCKITETTIIQYTAANINAEERKVARDIKCISGCFLVANSALLYERLCDVQVARLRCIHEEIKHLTAGLQQPLCAERRSAMTWTQAAITETYLLP